MIPAYSDTPRWHCGSCAQLDSAGRFNDPPPFCRCFMEETQRRRARAARRKACDVEGKPLA